MLLTKSWQAMSSPPSAYLDTSCIVRYLTGEPEEFAQRASDILDDERRPLVLSELVLVETAHVLESFYKVPRDPVVDALSALIQRSNVQVRGLEKPGVLQALAKCRGSKRVSFTDAFVWAQARQDAVGRIYSFDKRFPSEGLEVLAK